MLMKRYDYSSGDVVKSTPHVEQAIGELLGTYAANSTALLSVSHDYLQVSVKRKPDGVEYFGLLVFEEEPGERDDFTRLARLARVLQLLNNWSDGEAEQLQPKALESSTNYRLVLPERRDALTRLVAARMAAQWILGRDVDWSGLEGPSLSSALALAVELELVDPTQRIEETIKSLLADA